MEESGSRAEIFVTGTGLTSEPKGEREGADPMEEASVGVAVGLTAAKLLEGVSTAAVAATCTGVSIVALDTVSVDTGKTASAGTT